MKKLVCAFAALASTAFAMPAAAETYGALFYQHKTMELSGASTPGVTLDDASLSEIGGKFGYQVNKNLGLEMDLTFGISEETIHTAPDVKVRTDASAFIYAVGSIPVNPKFSLLARAGYGHQNGKVTSSSGSFDVNDGAFTYGVGAQYMVNAQSGIRAEYTRYDIPDVETSSFTVGYVRKF